MIQASASLALSVCSLRSPVRCSELFQFSCLSFSFVVLLSLTGQLCHLVFHFRAGLIAHLYAHPSHNPSAVGPLELANALAACCLSSRLSSQHRQWAAQQLVRTLAAHDRDNNHSRPQTFADMAGDLRKCSFIKLEAHQGRVSRCRIRSVFAG